MNAQLASYRTTATATRNRRQAAGLYPTNAHKAAFRKYMSGGAASLSRMELLSLATHPCLTEKQRLEFAWMAQGANA